MKALTVRQPWAWAIAAGLKRFENRKWKPSDDVIGQWIAIHAAKNPVETLDELQRCQMLAGRELPHLDLGVVVCVARLAGVYRAQFGQEGAVVLREASRFAKTVEIRPEELRWIEGPYCFFFDQVRRTPLLEARGALNLWRVPNDVAAKLAATFPYEGRP